VGTISQRSKYGNCFGGNVPLRINRNVLGMTTKTSFSHFIVSVIVGVSFIFLPNKIRATVGAAEWEQEFVFNKHALIRQYFIDGVCLGVRGCFELVDKKKPHNIFPTGKLKTINFPKERNSPWGLAETESGDWMVLNTGDGSIFHFQNYDEAVGKYSIETNDFQPQIISHSQLEKNFRLTVRGLFYRNIIHVSIFLFFMFKIFTFFVPLSLFGF
jgi:hypothetical protein